MLQTFGIDAGTDDVVHPYGRLATCAFTGKIGDGKLVNADIMASDLPKTFGNRTTVSNHTSQKTQPFGVYFKTGNSFACYMMHRKSEACRVNQHCSDPLTAQYLGSSNDTLDWCVSIIYVCKVPGPHRPLEARFILDIFTLLIR